MALTQAALEAERLMLQARLKHALKPRLVPKTTLDTASPIDRAVLLLDGFLEVSPCHMLSHAVASDCRMHNQGVSAFRKGCDTFA